MKPVRYIGRALSRVSCVDVTAAFALLALACALVWVLLVVAA